MNKKSFVTLEKVLFERLADKEEKLMDELVSLRANPDLVSFIYSLYNQATDFNGKVNYNKLMARVDARTADYLTNRAVELTEQLNTPELQPVLAEYPFTVLRFDVLNKIEASSAYYAMEELAMAIKEAQVIQAHFEEWADTVFAMVETYFGLRGLNFNPPSSEWQCEFLEQRVKLGAEVGYNIGKGILRNQTADQTIDQVSYDLGRKEQSITNRVLFTENTRITEQTAVDVVEPFVLGFRTVCVKDNKTCIECKDIERSQQSNPVPIEDYQPTVTAPPFHPYCRCYIEFLWTTKDGEMISNDND